MTGVRIERPIDDDAEVELPAAVALMGPLARRAVKKGVDDNFATLKSVL